MHCCIKNPSSWTGRLHPTRRTGDIRQSIYLSSLTKIQNAREEKVGELAILPQFEGLLLVSDLLRRNSHGWLLLLL